MSLDTHQQMRDSSDTLHQFNLQRGVGRRLTAIFDKQITQIFCHLIFFLWGRGRIWFINQFSIFFYCLKKKRKKGYNPLLKKNKINFYYIHEYLRFPTSFISNCSDKILCSLLSTFLRVYFWWRIFLRKKCRILDACSGVQCTLILKIFIKTLQNYQVWRIHLKTCQLYGNTISYQNPKN